MFDNPSIQEIPSIDEVSPTKFRPKRNLIIDSHVPSRLSVNSSKSSPELKRCSILCPRDQQNMFFQENQLDRILKKADRTLNEAVLLYKNIKNFEFLRKFKEEQQKELCTTEALLHLCKSLKFEEFFPGTIIYRKDQESDRKIYLVFSGRVATATEAQERAAKESPPPRKMKPAKTINVIGSKEVEINPFTITRVKQAMNAFKKLIPKKSGSKGSDSGPKASPRDRKPQLKKEMSIITRLKTREGSRKISSEDNDRGSAEDKTKSTLETMIERKYTKEGTLGTSQTELKTSELQRNSSRPTQDDETIDRNIVRNIVIRRASRSKTVAEISTRSKTLTQIAQELSNPPKKDRRGSDGYAFLKLVPQIADIDSIGRGRFTSGEDFRDYENFLNAPPTNRSGNFDEIFTDKNPSKVQFAEDVLSREDSDDSSEDESIEISAEEGQVDKVDMVEKKKYGIRKGGVFGDEVLKSHCARKETMIATVYTKILTFTVDDYDYITTRFEKSNTKRLNFLLDHVPGLEKAIKYDKLRNVETYFQELDFSIHNHIVREGEKGKNVYIIFEGTCKVFKGAMNPSDQPSLSSLESSRSKLDGASGKILMCLIQAGAFIGEEILFQESKLYQFTVRAASANVKVLSIKKKIFMRIMPFDVINSLKELHMSRYEHNKIMFAHKLKVSTSLALPSKNPLLKKFTSITACKDLIHSFSRKKMADRERLDSSLQESLRGPISSGQTTPRSLGAAPNDLRSNSLISRTMIMPKSHRTLSQDEIPPQEGEMSRSPRKYTVPPALSPVVGKAWDTQIRLQIMPHTNKSDLKGFETPVKTIEENMQKLKGSWTKFAHLSTLETSNLSVDFTIKKPDEIPVKPLNMPRTPVKSFNTTITQLPKIDPSDISGLRFDFGDKGKEKGNKSMKNPLITRVKGATVSLKNSRECSPRDHGVTNLICMVSPKNSNFLINHARAKSGSIVTPKALLASCQEIKQNIQTKSENKKKAERFTFPAVINPSPVALKSPKADEQVSKESRMSTTTLKSMMTSGSPRSLKSSVKNRASRLVLQIGVLGRGCVSRNTSEGKSNVGPWCCD